MIVLLLPLSHSLILTSYPVCPTQKNKDSKKEQRSGNRKRCHFIYWNGYMWSPLSSLSRLLAWGGKGRKCPETWMLLQSLAWVTKPLSQLQYITYSLLLLPNIQICTSLHLVSAAEPVTSMCLCLSLFPTLGFYLMILSISLITQTMLTEKGHRIWNFFYF